MRNLNYILLGASALLCISGLLMYKSNYNAGYMDGRHDGWWARDEGKCMYDTYPCNSLSFVTK